MIWTERMCGQKRGLGLRNYDYGPFKEVLANLEDVRKKQWQLENSELPEPARPPSHALADDLLVRDLSGLVVALTEQLVR